MKLLWITQGFLEGCPHWIGGTFQNLSSSLFLAFRCKISLSGSLCYESCFLLARWNCLVSIITDALLFQLGIKGYLHIPKPQKIYWDEGKLLEWNVYKLRCLQISIDRALSKYGNTRIWMEAIQRKDTSQLVNFMCVWGVSELLKVPAKKNSFSKYFFFLLIVYSKMY